MVGIKPHGAGRVPRIRDVPRAAGSLLAVSDTPVPAPLMEMIAAWVKGRIHLLVAQWNALPARRLSRRGLIELTDEQLRDIGIPHGGGGCRNIRPWRD